MGSSPSDTITQSSCARGNPPRVDTSKKCRRSLGSSADTRSKFPSNILTFATPATLPETERTRSWTPGMTLETPALTPVCSRRSATFLPCLPMMMPASRVLTSARSVSVSLEWAVVDPAAPVGESSAVSGPEVAWAGRGHEKDERRGSFGTIQRKAHRRLGGRGGRGWRRRDRTWRGLRGGGGGGSGDEGE